MMRGIDTLVAPPLHPGEVLADELKDLEITAAGLARELHVPSNRLYQIIAGKRALTADTALRLEQWLGVSAQFWLNLQQCHDLELTKAEVGEEIKRTIRRRATDGSG